MKASFYLISLAFVLSGEAVAQGKFSTMQGRVSFTSNAALELIRANSEKLQGRIDPSTNQFAFLVPIQSFQGFNSELQRQHFNDKYLESDQFPNGTFSGKIIDEVDFEKNGTYEVRVKGDLDIHGQKQTRIIRGTITVNGTNVILEAHFTVPLSDHSIAIPNIVSQKIATEIDVVVQANMKLQSS